MPTISVDLYLVAHNVSAQATVEEGGPPLHLKVVLDKPPYPGREVHVHLDVAYPDDRAQLELGLSPTPFTANRQLSIVTTFNCSLF